MLILLLSCADAFLTLTLIHLGASELNPLMRPLVLGDSAQSFALWKLSLTAGGIVTLTVLARLRAFGRLRIGWLLYAVLLIYVVLIAYELWLLDHMIDQESAD